MKEINQTSDDKKLLKKQLKLSERDDRGVQTLFRTLSKNHYTLLEMIDRKASIILTINSIIISLLLAAAVLSRGENTGFLELISTVMINCCIFSMLFALLAIRPHQYKMSSSKHDHDGLLYAGSFKQEDIDSFQAKINDLLNNGKKMYDSMIRDLFYIGISVRSRQLLVYISIGIFVLGLIISLLIQLINAF